MKKLFSLGLLTMLIITACKKDKENPPEPDAETQGSWQFTTGGKTFSGKIEQTLFTDWLGGKLLLAGYPASGSTDSAFSLSVQFTDGIALGAFTTEDAGTNFALTKMPDGIIIYAASVLSAPLPDWPGQVITGAITAYDADTRIITGTFSGKAYTAEDEDVLITNGSFKATIKL